MEKREPDAAKRDEVDMAGLASIARSVWSETRGGEVVWLRGDLGTGKTTFVKVLLEAVGVDAVSSPSFALVNEYSTNEGTVYHSDCYRIRDPDEAIDLDLARMARDGRLLVIEWPERAGVHAPSPDLVLHFDYGSSEDLRRITVDRC